MIPIILDGKIIPIALIGEGEPAKKRLALLREGGAEKLTLFSPAQSLKAEGGEQGFAHLPSEEELSSFAVIFIAGIEEKTAYILAEKARKANVLVNLEDVKTHCDFHVPALIRRGRLLFTVSTGGASPALARRLKEYLGKIFPEIWKERVEELAEQRRKWRKQNCSFVELSEKSNHWIEEKKWLEKH